MKVLKFGGSSVQNATAMSRVLDIVEEQARSERVVLISSAIKGCTDDLIKIGEEEDPEKLLNELQERHLAIIRRLFTGTERNNAIAECKEIFSDIRCIPPVIESFGEILSTRILARKLSCEGYKAVWLDSRELVVTLPGSTEVNPALTYPKIQEAVAACPQARIFVAPGFIASTPSGSVTTLGRGGSDYSASIYAAALSTPENPADLQIWTDVPGIMTADPRVVPSARSIPRISYRAAFDMASAGAKVLYAPAVTPAREKGIPIKILNSFAPGQGGTVISADVAAIPEYKGVALMETAPGESLLTLTAEGPVGTGSTLRRMSGALRDAGIKPLGSPDCHAGTNFTLSVRSKVASSAVAAIHREFFERRALSTLEVYIAGTGAVGGALKEIIDSAAGVFPSAGKQIIIKGFSSDRGFVEQVAAEAPAGSIFVDCTDSEDIWRHFVPLLSAGVSIVCSNRRSLSVPYVDYAAMKAAAAENGCFLRYDTTVGNTLPILQSIGSNVTGIEAVVSCTLNQLLTSYRGTRGQSFASLLREAQDSGLTESDPRTDLAGKDALRKLLILAREAGVPLEAADVQITPMLSADFFTGGLEDFYRALEEAEPRLAEEEEALRRSGLRRRFVAEMSREPGGAVRASISMRKVGADSPYYWIDGTQNVIVIHSEDAYPLVIKGSGEGARLAANGIIKNILG